MTESLVDDDDDDFRFAFHYFFFSTTINVYEFCFLSFLVENPILGAAAQRDPMTEEFRKKRKVCGKTKLDRGERNESNGPGVTARMWDRSLRALLFLVCCPSLPIWAICEPERFSQPLACRLPIHLPLYGQAAQGQSCLCASN